MSIGLDVGTRTIKIVELEKEGEKFSLKATGVIAYSGFELGKLTEEKGIVPVVETVKKLFKDTGISSKEVLISIPEQHVFTRSIKFPYLSDQEIALAIKWEAEQYIPIPVAEAIIQHLVIERNEKATPPYVSVLLVAAPREVVEKFVDVVQKAGLSVVSVETELLALSRSLAPIDKTVLLIDFGFRSTDIAIVKNGTLVFTRTIPMAGETFTRAISLDLAMEEKQAEEYKRTYGLSADQLEGKIKKVLDPVFRMISDEIKKAVHYYQTEDKGDAPLSVILSGGTAGLPNATAYLAKLLGTEVLIANPFAKIAVDPEILKTLMPYAHLYAIACGLAMKED